MTQLLDEDLSLLQDARSPGELYDAALAIRDAVCPEYATRSPTDPGNVQYRVATGLVSMQQARDVVESRQLYVEHAKRPSAMANLLRLGGIDYPGPGSAVVDVVLTALRDPPTEAFTVPAMTLFRAPGPDVSFASVADVVWQAGATSVVVPCIQGEERTATLGTGDGTRGQWFDTEARDVLQNESQQSVKLVSIQPGTNDALSLTWIQDFHTARPADAVFVTRRNPNGTLRVYAGNGENGQVFPSGSTMRAQFLVTKGALGNVGAGLITEVSEPLLDGTGHVYQVTCSNPEPAVGGQDAPTLEQMRRLAPTYARTPQNATSLLSHEDLALRVSGIIDAVARRVDDGTTLTVVEVSIVGNVPGGGVTAALAQEVTDYLADRAWAREDIVVRSAVPILVDVELTVRLSRGQSASAARSTLIGLLGPCPESILENARLGVASAIASAQFYLFDPRARAATGLRLLGRPDSLAGHLYLSDLVAAIDGLPGIANLDVNRLQRQPRVRLVQQRGSMTLGDITPGPSITSEEVISVRALSATDVRVDGSINGFLGTGTIGQTFSSAIVSFTSSGTAQRHDLHRFTIGPRVGNVRMDRDEFFGLGNLTLTVS